MSRDIVNKKILDKIMSNPKIRGMLLQSVRNAISDIHKNNHGITMNAAASEFARRKEFNVYRYLSEADKSSLQHLKITDDGIREIVPAKRKQRKVKELRVEFETQFASEAYNNANIYPYIYILENSLRTVIFNKFGTDIKWWQNETVVAKGIQDYSKRIQEAEKKYPWLKKRGEHPIFYVGLFELFKIVEKNWQQFRNIFKDLEQLRAWIKECVPIRNLVAHNVKTRDKERKRIETNTDYICRMVEGCNNLKTKEKF